jgi:hypothetical protein
MIGGRSGNEDKTNTNEILFGKFHGMNIERFRCRRQDDFCNKYRVFTKEVK